MTFLSQAFHGLARGKYLIGFGLFTVCSKSLLTIMHCSRSKGGPTIILHYLGSFLCHY